MSEIKTPVETLVTLELFFANQKHPPFNSQHEGAAVILEELDEAREDLSECIGIFKTLWANVRRDESANTPAEILRKKAIDAACECIQVAAMAQKFVDSGVKR